MTTNLFDLRKIFEKFANNLIKQLSADEKVSVTLAGEYGKYCRFAQSKVRQLTSIDQKSVSIVFQKGEKEVQLSQSLGPMIGKELQILKQLRQSAARISPDVKKTPLPTASQSTTVSHANLPAEDVLIKNILKPVAKLNFVGILFFGTSVRAVVSSLGANHWFYKDDFSLDFSICVNDDKAFKDLYAGTVWDQATYENKIKFISAQSEVLAKPPIKIAPGQYRTYLTPMALLQLVGQFSWGVVSYDSYKKGQSFLASFEGKKLSPKFTLVEDYSMQVAPPFNEHGEVLPTTLDIFRNGEHKNFLISSKNAQKYGVVGNNAHAGEYLTSARILPGNLAEEDILEQIGTGLYIGNLWYLNWSDQANGRVTGMTRHQCFWVENGKIVAPIVDLRFDEQMTKIFGENLIDLTKTAQLIPSTSSYGVRAQSGKMLPGALVDKFTYTL